MLHLYLALFIVLLTRYFSEADACKNTVVRARECKALGF